MNSTDKFNSLDYEVTNNWLKYFIWIILAISIFMGVLGFIMKSPTKIVENYEWFHQSYAKHSANVANISSADKLYRDETDEKERQRLRIELSSMKQVCALNVQNYNARSAQITTSWVQGESLPKTINLSTCN